MDDPTRKDVGSDAESAALDYLRARQLKLVARNYRCKAGELDLIMLEGETLALVEVRYRSALNFGGAAASITRRKQRRIIAAAGHLLLTRPELRRFAARFDVIAISSGPTGRHIEWIKGAFAV